MTATTTARINRRQVRDMQRAAHVLSGLALLVHVYAGSTMGPAYGAAVEWLLVPAMVISGMVMWKGRRLRVLLFGGRR